MGGMEPRTITHRAAGATGVVLVAIVVAACGGSVPRTSSAGLPTRGPGLTQPTHPSGTRVAGGTVYFTEAPNAPPDYIFPLYTFDVCATPNVDQFMDMMYRPLYWYGNDDRPTVDYSYSIGRAPLFSDDDRTVTIKLNPWKWSDGETVTSRDLEFWMDVVKASPATEWCGYIPGYFPDNVTSYSAPDAETFVLHFNRSYNPEWLLYNELSQLTPMPLAWDRTSLAQPARTRDDGDLPDTTKAGASAVYKFLDDQARKLGGWNSSPLWRVVDGPFRLQSLMSSGEATLVPNPEYSGAPKPTISKLVELPFDSDAATYFALRSGGPRALTIANVPSQYAGVIPTLAGEGYDVNRAATYAFTYLPMNFNSNASTSPGGEPVRFIFRQPYFRQAFQHLVDQQAWIEHILYGAANPNCGPIPLSPPSPLVDAAGISAGPCAFSVQAAGRLLTDNGWKLAPGATTTCARPGSGLGDCGVGIKAGEGISFNLDYVSGNVPVQDEMADLASQARKVGINISPTTHTASSVLGSVASCRPRQAVCT